MSRPTPEAARSAVSPSQAISTATTIALSTIHTLTERSLRTAPRRAGGLRPIGRLGPGWATLGHGDRTRREARDRERVRRWADGGGRGQEPRGARVPSGGPRGRHLDRAPPPSQALLPGSQAARAHDRARTRADVSRPVGRRPR